jgi:cell division protein FtsA
VDNDEPITIQVQNTTKQISRRLLASVVEPRVEEILLHADGEIRKSGLAETLAAGVVLTGGGARLPGIDALAEQIMNLPVRVGHAVGVQGPDEVLTNPSFVPAVGLVRYGLRGATDIGNAVIDTERNVSLWKRITRSVTRRTIGKK